MSDKTTAPETADEETVFADLMRQRRESEAKPEAPVEAVANEPQQPETAQEPQETPAEDEPFPGYASLSEEAKKKFQELAAAAAAAKDYEDRWKAQAGQLAPIQRKLAQRERELQELRTRATQQPMPKPAEKDDRIEKWRNELGEDAEVIDTIVGERVKPLLSETEQLKAELRALREQEARNAELRELESAYPDWRDKLTSDDFDAWKSGLSADERNDIDNLLDQWDANAYKRVLRWFNHDLRIADEALRLEQLGKAGAPPKKPTPDPSPRRVAATVAGEASGDPDEDTFATIMRQRRSGAL